MYSEVSAFMTGISRIYDYISKPCSKERLEFFDNIIKLYFGNESIKILDMSASTGETSIKLSNFGHNVLGIDFSAGMIDVATDKARKQKNSPEFKLLNMKNIASLESNFDLIFNNSLIWISKLEDVRNVIKNMINKVDENGIIIIDIPNSYKFLSKYKSLYCNTVNVGSDVIYKIVRYYKNENTKSNELMLNQTYLKLDYETKQEVTHSCDFEIRLHHKDELVDIIHYYDFEIKNVYGDYSIVDNGRCGHLQIVACSK